VKVYLDFMVYPTRGHKICIQVPCHWCVIIRFGCVKLILFLHILAIPLAWHDQWKMHNSFSNMQCKNWKPWMTPILRKKLKNSLCAGHQEGNVDESKANFLTHVWALTMTCCPSSSVSQLLGLIYWPETLYICIPRWNYLETKFRSDLILGLATKGPKP
jgi:hypothetical protein